MPTINRVVIDISHWQDKLDWAAIKNAGIVGVIHKATEGNYNSDATYAERRIAAAEHGFLWGAYHFATANNVAEQVSRFLSYAKPDRDTLVCLDWEDYKSQMSLGQVKEWIERVEAALKRPNGVVLYSGNRVKDELGSKKDEFLGNRRLWLCQYGNSPTVQPSWKTYWLWQYSDGTAGPQPRNCPGVTGNCDTNSFEGPTSKLIDEWSGVPVEEPGPAPEPEPEKQTVTINVTAPKGVQVVVNVNGKRTVSNWNGDEIPQSSL